MPTTWLISLLLASQAANDTKKVPASPQGEWCADGWKNPDGSSTLTWPRRGRGLIIMGDKASWQEFGILKAGKGTVTFDTSASPPRIELKSESATYRGIYNFVETPPHLTIEFSHDGKEYPKELSKTRTKNIFDISFQPPPPPVVGKYKGDDPKDPFRGSWTVVAEVSSGEKTNEFMGWKYIFKDGKLFLRQKGSSEEYEHAVYSFDLGTKPSRLDVIPVWGQNRARTQRYVFEVKDGDLKLCGHPYLVKAQYPNELASTPKNDLGLLTLKREKP